MIFDDDKNEINNLIKSINYKDDYKLYYLLVERGNCTELEYYILDDEFELSFKLECNKYASKINSEKEIRNYNKIFSKEIKGLVVTGKRFSSNGCWVKTTIN